MLLLLLLVLLFGPIGWNQIDCHGGPISLSYVCARGNSCRLGIFRSSLAAIHTVPDAMAAGALLIFDLANRCCINNNTTKFYEAYTYSCFLRQ